MEGGQEKPGHKWGPISLKSLDESSRRQASCERQHPENERERQRGREGGREDRRKDRKKRQKSTLRKFVPFGEWVRTSKIKLRLNSQVHLRIKNL